MNVLLGGRGGEKEGGERGERGRGGRGGERGGGEGQRGGLFMSAHCLQSRLALFPCMSSTIAIVACSMCVIHTARTIAVVEDWECG